jgi:serine/threonine protein kinase
MGTRRKNDDEDPKSITDDVRDAQYYHGLVPRADVEPLLRKDGEFLLRKTEIEQRQIALVLAVRVGEGVKHFMVNEDPDGRFYIETHREKTISDLIEWHRSTRTPVSSASGVRLRRPIERPDWLLNHDAITTGAKLGEGAFGEVFEATYTEGGRSSRVAVKTMREQSTREARLKFMREARLMRRYSHKHVVRILGVAVHEQPLMIVMELSLGGSLLAHLRKHKAAVDAAKRLRFCVEAADGLAYLERQKCIHRDVAARNCLLGAKGELKISDFGMSDDKRIMQDDKLGRMPVKWLAPETLQDRIFSSKTDVWAFGVLVWEIYANGAEPYPGLNNMQTRAKIVVQKYRMEMPIGTPPSVVCLVAICWAENPDSRPTFKAIYGDLKNYK